MTTEQRLGGRVGHQIRIGRELLAVTAAVRLVLVLLLLVLSIRLMSIGGGRRAPGYCAEVSIKLCHLMGLGGEETLAHLKARNGADALRGLNCL